MVETALTILCFIAFGFGYISGKHRTRKTVVTIKGDDLDESKLDILVERVKELMIENLRD